MPNTQPIPNRKLILGLAVWLAYALVFVAAHFLFQAHAVVPTLTTLVVLPVMVTAWFFGMWAGLFSALLAFPLNMLILLLLAHDPRVMLGGAGLSGSMMLLFIGAIVGRVSDLQARVRREMAERKRVEDIIAARLRLHQFAATHSVEELLQATLDELEILTGSRIGFNHFLLADQQTLSLQTWSTRTLREMCQAEGKGRHYDVSEAGVWVDCVRERRPVIHNDYASLPASRRKGMPPGHAAIVRELVVPVFRGGRIVAILGVGNKPEDYTERDVETVSNLADLAWDITERKHAEEALRQSEERWRSLVHNAPDTVTLVDRNARILFINRVPAGVSQEAVVGHTLYDFMTEEYRAIAETALERVFTLGEPQEYQVVATRVDRQKRWYDNRIGPVIQGETVGAAIVITTDISERKQAEETLQTSEERYRVLYDRNPSMYVTLDAQGTVLAVNPYEAEQLGYTVEELVGQSVLKVFYQDDRESVQQHLATCLQNPGQVSNWEFRKVRKDGTMLWVREAAQAVPWIDGSMVVLMVCEDITERKRAESTLLKLRQAVETSGEVIFMTDREGIITLVNPEFTRLYGYIAEEVVGKATPRILKSGVMKDADYEIFWQTLLSKQVVKREFINRTKEDRLITIEASANPILDERGEIIGFLAVQHDITARKRAEETLRESEERLRTVIEQSPVGIAFSRDGITLDANPVYLRMFGYADIAELRGMPLIEQIAPQCRAEIADRVRRRAQGQKTETAYETIGLRKDGSQFPFFVSVNRIVLPDGKPLTISFFIDITERKRTEEMLHESEERYRLLVDNSPYAIGVHQDGKIVFANAAAGRLFAAQSADELIGRPIQDLVHPENWQAARERIGRLYQGETGLYPTEDRYVRLDGSAVPVEVTAAGFTYAGRPAIQVIALEITERKWAEKALREKLAALQALAEIDREISAAVDMPHLLPLICRHAAELLHAPKSVVTISDSSLEMRGSVSFGLTDAAAMSDEFARHWREVELLRSDSPTHELVALDEIPADDPIMPEFRARENIRALMVAPLVVSGQVRGAMAVFDTAPRHWTADERQLLELLAGQAAIALDKTQLFAEEQTRRAELATLYDLARTLAGTDELQTILEKVVRDAAQILHITFARLALVEDNTLVIRAAHPVRLLERDLQAGEKEPLEAHPLCRQALAENTPIVLQADDARIGAVERACFLLDTTQSVCLVPLRAGDTALGVLLLGEARRVEREPFNAAKFRLARSIGDQAGGAIQRALLRAQIEKHVQQLEALHQIDLTISSSTDLRPTLNTLVDQTARQLRADAVDILLYDPATLTLEYAAGRGFRTGAIARSRLRLGQGYAGRAALNRRLIVLTDVTHAENLARWDLIEGEGFVTYVGAPLVAKGQIKGVLEVFQRTSFDPDAGWLGFLEMLAQQAAIAIDSAQSFEGLQRRTLDLALAYDSTLEGWARALELRDRETEGHSQRVTEMTVRLARATGMSEEELIHVRRGALLHDIGKMGVPDSILLKPGKLTDAEWKIMRQHPQYAYDMLESIAYLRPALDIPYCHHEKWDGTGYPRGLKGDHIPLAARLFAVVDVWDALRSDRPYRQGWPDEKVREHIQALAGTHFDPKAVELFLRV